MPPVPQRRLRPCSVKYPKEERLISIGNIWDMLIINPLSTLLLLMYSIAQNYGLAIILFALVSKLLLLFFSAKGKRSMMQQQRLQPKLQELQKQYGKDKQKFSEMQMKLYQDEGISPFGGCLWSLLPLPIFFALFAVIRSPLTNLMKLSADQIAKISEFFGETVQSGQASYYVQMNLAQKIHENYDAILAAIPELPRNLLDINFDFFPGFNLAPTPNLPWSGGWNWLILIPLLSCATAYLQMFLTQKFSGNKMQQPGSMKGMFLMMPLFSLWIGFSTPAAMGVYWITNNVLTIIQEYFLTRHYKKVMAEEDKKREDLMARRKAAEEAIKAEERERKAQEIAERKAKNKPKVYKVTNNPQQKKKKPEDK